MKRQIVLFLILSLAFGSATFAQSKKTTKKSKPTSVTKDTSSTIADPLMTFVELGSVNCIPCKAMQKVMKSVKEKYGSQIKLVFYDVWKEEQAHFAKDYHIRLIPTQVFLDTKGKELMRHEGYFPEKELDTFLQSKGLKPNSNGKG
jgi:thioredoxin 1